MKRSIGTEVEVRARTSTGLEVRARTSTGVEITVSLLFSEWILQSFLQFILQSQLQYVSYSLTFIVQYVPYFTSYFVFTVFFVICLFDFISPPKGICNVAFEVLFNCVNLMIMLVVTLLTYDL